jgi:hypothetical protein
MAGPPSSKKLNNGFVNHLITIKQNKLSHSSCVVSGNITHPFIPSLVREGKPEGRGELKSKQSFEEFSP